MSKLAIWLLKVVSTTNQIFAVVVNFQNLNHFSKNFVEPLQVISLSEKVLVPQIEVNNRNIEEATYFLFRENLQLHSLASGLVRNGIIIEMTMTMMMMMMMMMMIIMMTRMMMVMYKCQWS